MSMNEINPNTTQPNLPLQSPSPNPSPSLPIPYLIPPAILALGGVALLWLLVQFWGIEPAYGDRFLILIAAGWLVYRLWPRWKQEPIRTSWIGLVPLTIGMAAAPPVWNLVAQVGTRTILIWWYALALVCLVGGYLLLCWGRERFRLLVFPLGFTLFALPLPQRVHDSIQGQLQEKTTILASKILSLSGVSVERQGFQLHLPSGDLEVVEACSGIRSVTALLAIAALVAYLRGFSLIRGILFFMLAFPIIAFGNVIRIVCTGLLQEGFGHAFIEGFTHDLLGILVILVGLGLIVLTAKLFGDSRNDLLTPPSPQTRITDFRPRLNFLVSAALAICFLASFLCYQSATTSQSRQAEKVRLDTVPLNLGSWEGSDLEISEAVQLQLAPEQALRRHYLTNLGQEAEAWVLYWSSTRGMRGYHHPDLCMPNHGWTLVGQEKVDLTLSDGTTFPLKVRRYRQKNREQMVCYWNQEGGRIWSSEDEERLRQADSFGLIRERLFQTRPPEVGRLAFLVAAELGGNRNYSAHTVLTLTAELAEQVYLSCPWAKP